MTTRRSCVWTTVIGGLVLLFLAAAQLSPWAWAAGGNRNAGIVPPNANFRGLSYEDLEALQWQNLYSIPVVNGDHPLISGGAYAEENGIVLLAAPFGGAEIDVTISPGTALFVPIVTAACSAFEPDPFHGDDEAAQRECANNWMDHTYDLAATLDGKSINNLEDYRFESEQFEWGPLPENNIFEFFGLDAPAGTTSTAVDAGYYLLLKPLSVGEHQLHIQGTFDPLTPEDPTDDLVIDTTFLIDVVPPGRRTSGSRR